MAPTKLLRKMADTKAQTSSSSHRVHQELLSSITWAEKLDKIPAISLTRESIPHFIFVNYQFSLDLLPYHVHDHVEQDKLLKSPRSITQTSLLPPTSLPHYTYSHYIRDEVSSNTPTRQASIFQESMLTTNEEYSRKRLRSPPNRSLSLERNSSSEFILSCCCDGV